MEDLEKNKEENSGNTVEGKDENTEIKNESTSQETIDSEKKESKNKFFKKKNKNPESEELQKKIEELTQKTEEQGKTMIELNDRYLRINAEFDNYRKRTLKEKMDLTKYASENILLGIIPVADDFERGMQTMTNAQDIEAVKEGVSLIYNKFREFLTQKGIKEIEALNQEFNTDLHEAITKIPAPSEDMKGKVIDVVEKGYMLYDKVIRFSKVVIGEQA